LQKENAHKKLEYLLYLFAIRVKTKSGKIILSFLKNQNQKKGEVKLKLEFINSKLHSASKSKLLKVFIFLKDFKLSYLKNLNFLFTFLRNFSRNKLAFCLKIFLIEKQKLLKKENNALQGLNKIKKTFSGYKKNLDYFFFSKLMDVQQLLKFEKNKQRTTLNFILNKLSVCSNQKSRFVIHILTANHACQNIKRDSQIEITAHRELFKMSKSKFLLSLLIASQLTKLKAAFFKLTDEVKMIIKTANKIFYKKYQVFLKLQLIQNNKILINLKELKTYNSIINRNESIKKEKFQNGISKILGNFDQLIFFHSENQELAQFLEKLKLQETQIFNSEIRQITLFMKSNNYQNIYSECISVFENKMNIGYFEFCLKIVSILETSLIFKNDKFKKFKNCIYSFLSKGKTKNANFANWFCTHSVFETKIYSKLAEKLKFSDEACEQEFLEYLKNFSHSDSIEVKNFLNDCRLTDSLRNIFDSFPNKINCFKDIKTKNPKISDFCLMSKDSSGKSELVLLKNEINRKYFSTFDRVLSLFSSFYEIYNKNNEDVYCLLKNYSIQNTTDIIELLNFEILDLPFIFADLLKNIINENFETVSFKKINLCLKEIITSDFSRMPSEDLKIIYQIFKNYEEQKKTQNQMSHIELFLKISQIPKLSKFCFSIIHAFHLSDIIKLFENIDNFETNEKKNTQIFDESRFI
jgi:hypothetical protein